MRSATEQLETFKKLLEGKVFPRDSKIFGAVLEFTRKLDNDIPLEEKDELRLMILRSFQMSENELTSALVNYISPKVEIIPEDDPWRLENELDAMLPRSGFFRRYIEYTRNSEAPLAYHFFCALVAMGATLNRRVRFDMHYFKIYPPLGVLILGPSGIKKTSAADIAVNILTELALTKIYSEKLTPEALIDAMKGGEQANGLVYAPEMAVFLSKQRYMEGIVPLLTRFMDCPDKWESGTIMRGNSQLRNVAISVLMCSTLDWFISNTPEDTFGGGFIARNILVVQNTCPRVQPRPRPGDPTERDRLIEMLAYFHATFEGEMTRRRNAEKRYDEWYDEQKKLSQNLEHDLLATYYQRKPIHVQRIAMLLHIAEHCDLELCVDCFERACSILNWTEQFLPGMLRQMFKTSMGADQELVLRSIRAEGGSISHSRLIQKMQYRMNAQQVRGILSSLKEANDIVELNGNLGHIYRIKGAQ